MTQVRVRTNKRYKWWLIFSLMCSGLFVLAIIVEIILLLILFIFGQLFDINTIRYLNDNCVLVNVTSYKGFCQKDKINYDHDYIFYVWRHEKTNKIFSSLINDMIYSDTNDTGGATEGEEYDPGLLECRDEYTINIIIGTKISCGIRQSLIIRPNAMKYENKLINAPQFIITIFVRLFIMISIFIFIIFGFLNIPSTILPIIFFSDSITVDRDTQIHQSNHVTQINNSVLIKSENDTLLSAEVIL